MELNEMEKRLIFQTEGYGKSDVTYELRMRDASFFEEYDIECQRIPVRFQCMFAGC